MASEKETLIARVQSSYQKLSASAASLNSASDTLGQSVLELDSALKRLNVGISSWHSFSSWESSNGADYSSEDVGYAKINGKWGIAIRTVSGCIPFPGEDQIEEWHFNEAPRELRVRAIDKIPDLLEKLATDAAEITSNIREKTSKVRDFTAAISMIHNQSTKDSLEKR